MPDRLLYAVGDIHGRADLLEQMIDAIEIDAAGAEGDLVFLGDYIDRGPESAAVLRRLCGLRVGHLRVNCLMGNHEQMLLSFLEDPLAGEMWLRNGGMETISDFDPARRDPAEGVSPLQDLRDRLQRAMGQELVDWLRGLPLSFLSGTAGCVHGMADPKASWEMQAARGVLWGRPTAASTPRRDGIWVIHGHTVVPQAEIGPGRIAVDTGAYKSGLLSAVRCDGGESRFLTVGGAAQ